MIRSFPKIFVCFATLLILGISAHAEVTGSIFGSIVDPSGAAVPNATVMSETSGNWFVSPGSDGRLGQLRVLKRSGGRELLSSG